MDYSYFTAAPPPAAYQFIGLGHSDEKIGSADPLDTTSSYIRHHQAAQPYDAYPFSSAHIIPPTTAPTTGPSAGLPMAGSVDSGIGLDIHGETQHITAEPQHLSIERQNSMDADMQQALMREQRQRSSSEEKDGANLTPAQSRRKAQNRAAQRAFRERKERHVKDLEAKLASLEHSANTLVSDNERLKIALQRAASENAMLRRSSTTPHEPGEDYPDGGARGDALDPSTTDAQQHQHNAEPLYSTPPHQTHAAAADAEDPASEPTPLLPSAAAWDLIMGHQLVRTGKVDVADVVARLRTFSRCDGNGPVWFEADVRRAVEGARRGGGDTLVS